MKAEGRNAEEEPEAPGLQSELHPLAYASSNPHTLPDDYKVLGVTSIVAGVISAAVSGWWIFRSVGLPSSANEGSSLNIILIGLLLLAILLICAGIILCNSDSRGVTLHWIYVPLQLASCIALAKTLISDLSNSPAGPFSYFGVIPGAIAAIYPIAAIVLLVKAHDSAVVKNNSAE